MNSGDIVTEGFMLMLLGMGTVFVFLTLLVFVTSLMSSLVLKYAPPEPVGSSSQASTKLDDQRLVAVISAAIHAHRSRK